MITHNLGDDDLDGFHGERNFNNSNSSAYLINKMSSNLSPRDRKRTYIAMLTILVVPVSIVVIIYLLLTILPKNNTAPVKTPTFSSTPSAPTPSRLR